MALVPGGPGTTVGDPFATKTDDPNANGDSDSGEKGKQTQLPEGVTIESLLKDRVTLKKVTQELSMLKGRNRKDSASDARLTGIESQLGDVSKVLLRLSKGIVSEEGRADLESDVAKVQSEGQKTRREASDEESAAAGRRILAMAEKQGVTVDQIKTDSKYELLYSQILLGNVDRSLEIAEKLFPADAPKEKTKKTDAKDETSEGESEAKDDDDEEAEDLDLDTGRGAPASASDDKLTPLEKMEKGLAAGSPVVH